MSLRDEIASVLEAILTRRAIMQRLDGYTIETSKELADSILTLLPPKGWRPIESAEKNGQPILAKIHDNLFPRIRPEREDLKSWNGRWVVVHHRGLAPDGFDIGWAMSAPVGHGGFPDDWFEGWTALPAAPVTKTVGGGNG